MATLTLNVKDYGALGNGTANDTAAINTALAAVSAQGGGTLHFPAGTYMTDGGHSLPPYSHITGSEPNSRYWATNPTVSMPTACGLKLRPGTAATAMFAINSSYTAGSVRDISLLGNNVGTGIAGITFADPAGGINNVTMENVNIVQFSGDGIRGRLFASRFDRIYIGGCAGWGLNCPAGFVWTDVWFHQLIITECKLGGLNIDSTYGSGEVSIVNSRIERSGWDNGNITVPLNTNAPGIRLRGSLINSAFIGVSTDANSGDGLVVGGASDRSVHHVSFVGCRFNRDGFGNMSTQPGFAAVRVVGTSSVYNERITFVGCTTTEGKADDGGTYPSYLHPKYGLVADRTTFLSVTGGSISSGHTVPWSGGTANDNYRPLILTRIGNTSWTVVAAGTTAERPPPMAGGVYVNTETNKLQTAFNTTAWVDA